jgi:hypothetical protein
VRQDVGRCSRGIAIHNKPAVNEEDESSREKGEQIKDTGGPGLEARRRFCDSLHHYR